MTWVGEHLLGFGEDARPYVAALLDYSSGEGVRFVAPNLSPSGVYGRISSVWIDFVLEPHYFNQRAYGYVRSSIAYSGGVLSATNYYKHRLRRLLHVATGWEGIGDEYGD